jgi:putative ubiquitin-RnfH superfamily antitoxin RatB of RatAB toxin-antitoxin module
MLRLPEGSTLADALRASGIESSIPAHELTALAAGVWGRVADADTLLRQGDRVELYRPLKVDPKEARRLRYRRDGLKRKGVSGTRSK